MASQVETKPFCEFITKRTNIVVSQLVKKEIGLCLVYLTSKALMKIELLYNVNLINEN